MSVWNFFPGAFDPANPRKGGAFSVIQEKKYDNTPEDNGARGKPVRHGRSPKGELRGQQRIKLRHDGTDELAAYAARRGATRHSGKQTRPSSARERKLAQLPFPGVFGVFHHNDRPTKNALEKKWVDSTREKLGNPTDLALLQKTFDRMK